jgi:hypothetical protein
MACAPQENNLLMRTAMDGRVLQTMSVKGTRPEVRGRMRAVHARRARVVAPMKRMAPPCTPFRDLP